MEILWRYKMENLKPSTSMMEEEPIYSAGTFCFNKGLCMIWNKGTLSEDKPCLKSCYDLGFHSPNRSESDLSNQVLYILYRSKKSARSAGPRAHRTRICQSRQFLIDLQLWPLIFLQPLNLQGCTVPHLKDLIPICLENESQGHSMTLNMGYLCSKYPYFISYRGLC